MANVIYGQKIQSATKPFAGQFGHRENNLISMGYTAIVGDAAVVLKPLDGVTHVALDTTAGSLQVTVPDPAQCKNRVIHLRKSVATNNLTVVATGGANVGPTATLTQTAVGGLILFSTGTAWVQV